MRSVNLTIVTKIYQLQWTCESAVFLSRALSEAEPKAKAELSANHTCALKECRLEVQQAEYGLKAGKEFRRKNVKERVL